MREFLKRLLSAFQKQRQEREMDAEMQSHLALAIDELVARGAAPEEARREARLQFGGWEAARELHREARSLPFLGWLAQDLR